MEADWCANRAIMRFQTLLFATEMCNIHHPIDIIVPSSVVLYLKEFRNSRIINLQSYK